MIGKIVGFGRASSRSDIFTIEQLVAMATAGTLRLPRFQRPFVWDDKDVRLLFDSVARGFPIGTLLLWRRLAPAEVVEFGPVIVHAPTLQDSLAIVDGQQRITALVATLLPAVSESEQRDRRFDVFFDLRQGEFVGPKRSADPDRYVPLRSVFAPTGVLRWGRDHDLDEADIETVDALSAALHGYQVPAYVVEGDDSRVLREVFDRVNGAGKPISRAQVFHALLASDTEPGSPEMAAAELASSGVGTIPPARVVQSLLAIRGGDVQRDLHSEFDGASSEDAYEETIDALGATTTFLQQQGIPHLALMPSTLPLPVLAAFFHVHPQPEDFLEALLARWLWRGWVHGFGPSSGQTPILRRAVKAVNPIYGQPDQAPSAYDAIRGLLGQTNDEAVQSLMTDHFSTTSTNGRILLLALAHRAPRSPEGEVLDLPALLNEHGSSLLGQLVPGSREDVGRRGFWLPQWGHLSGREDEEVLRSQFVDAEGAALLIKDDLPAFVDRRQRQMVNAATRMVNSRMEPGRRMRPPISELFVPDPGEAR